MAYDEALADRIRERLAGTDALDLAERRMFGGIAFLEHGNMVVGVVGPDMMVRVGPDATDDALTRPGTRLFDMTGRPMRGWLVVDGGVLDDDSLAAWIEDARRFVATLPPK